MVGALSPSLDPDELAWAALAPQGAGSGSVGIAPQGALAAAPAQGALAPAAASAYPQAQNIESLMTTPEQAYQTYQQAHPFGSYLDMVRARLGGGEAGAEQERQALATRQMQPLALAQAKAQFAGMKALYAQLPPDQRAAFILDPKGFTDQFIKNTAVQKLGQGESLATPGGGVSTTAPMMGIDAQSGVPFSQTPQGFTPQGQLGGAYSAGANGVVSGRTGAFQGISQPVTAAPGSSVTQFTPGVGGADQASPSGGAPISTNYISRLTNGESSGNPSAQNPLSSASGLGGFVDGTWLNMLAAHRPDLTGGKSVQDINADPALKSQLLALKTNSALSQQMTAAYAGDNAPALQGAKLPVNDVNLAIAHGLGAAGAIKLLQADPATPMSQIVTPQAMKQNPTFKLMRAGDYIGAMQRRMGSGAAQGAPAPAASALGASPPTGSGFDGTIVQGKTNTPISPQEAMGLHLAPGVYQRDPTGKIEQVSAPPADDMKRVAGFTTALDTLNSLAENQRKFSALNAQAPETGLKYMDIGMHGHDMNPLTAYDLANNPAVSQMHALGQSQVLMVKPSNAGARILQSELPLWQQAVQGIDQNPEVNAARLADTQRQIGYMQDKQQFYNAWLYRQGNLNGADESFAQFEAKRGGAPSAQSAPAAQSGGNRPLSPEEAAKLPSGTPFVALDGRHLVRQ